MLRKPHWRKSVALQASLFAGVMVLWWLPIINPIKLLVVLFHEVSHVAAGLVTGGVVFGMAIDPGGAGVTLGMGGYEPLILAAGYAGSLLFGAVLYAAIAHWEPVEVWAGLCAASCVSLVFKWLNEFTAVFGYGAMIMLLIGLFALSPAAKKFWLRVIATTSCLYPLLDVAGELIGRSNDGFMVGGKVVGSDVTQFALRTGIPAELAGTFWILGGLILLLYLIDWSAEKDAETAVKGSLLRRRRPSARQGFTDFIFNPNNPDAVPEYELR